MAGARSPADGRSKLIGYAVGDRNPLAALCVERLRAGNAVYRSFDALTLLPSVSRVNEILMGVVPEDRELSRAELAEIEEHGRQRAAIGVSVDDLLHGWRLCAQAVTEAVARYGHAHVVAESALLRLIMDLHTLCNVAMIASVRGHRDAELEMVGSEYERRAEFVRDVLHATAGPTDIRVRAQKYGLDLGRNFHAIRARAATPGRSVTELREVLGLTGGADRGLFSLVDGDLAGFVVRPPRGAVDGYVGLGPSVAFGDLAHSFHKATRALTTAVLFATTGVHDMASLGVLPAVAADEEVGEQLALRYLAPLAVLPDEVAARLVATLECYLAHGQRVDPAAEELLIHPNTLRYRVKRYQELTACDLRQARTALEVWWAMQRARLHRSGRA
ncbi:helix-turn-helix domain-containing protein [Streptomyces sp. NPDC048636]|uniref:PucR family transcriptional regulator n=1 Tax=Streptomyces sp. NPDC048636 TaxID=3155762 RepID=UPI003412FD8C